MGGKINIEMDNTEVGWEGMDWRNSGQGKNQWPAFVNTVMNFQVLPKKKKTNSFLTSWANISFCRANVLHGLGWLIVWLVNNLVSSSNPRRLSAHRP